MYFQGKKTEQNKIEDTLEKAGGEETMSDKLKVNMNEYLPLRDVVFNTLRQAIITGEFAPGERLMEIALANRLGVSRTPVREAIRKLELEGLVVMIPRKGAEVARITEKDLRDVLEVRCSLEELAAFVGKNGEGKSTLVKCIMKEIEHDGTLTLGHNVQIGYFAQNQASLLDENLTVFQTIDDVAKGEIRNKIRDLLGAFMFGGPEQSMKKVKVLSGGERTRLAMIKLLLEPVNLLILDEPTNHLDLKTKDILKQALLDFDGTLIVVSHDRDFLDGLVTKVYEFGNKQVKEHLSGIYEFLEKKKMESLRELER